MNVLQTITREVSEPLTWAEICERHPHEWVCLVEIDRIEPNSFSFRTARVVGHGKTRGEPLRQARAWRQQYPCVGHYYTGDMVAPSSRFQSTCSISPTATQSTVSSVSDFFAS